MSLAQTMGDIGIGEVRLPMVVHRPPHWRQLKHLPSLVGPGGHVLQKGPTGPTTLDGMELAVVRLGRGMQRMALMAWLSPTLVATAGAETARAGLLQAVTARR